MDVLQQEIVKLLSEDVLTAGDIRNRPNDFPMGMDVSLDEVTSALDALRREGKVYSFREGNEVRFALRSALA